MLDFPRSIFDTRLLDSSLPHTRPLFLYRLDSDSFAFTTRSPHSTQHDLVQAPFSTRSSPPLSLCPVFLTLASDFRLPPCNSSFSRPPSHQHRRSDQDDRCGIEVTDNNNTTSTQSTEHQETTTHPRKGTREHCTLGYIREGCTIAVCADWRGHACPRGRR